MLIDNWDEIRRRHFWAKVQGGPECWIWKGAVVNGYGKFNIGNHRAYTASRLMYMLAFGVDPGKLLVCHHCDNRTCVNPNHFFIGDSKANLLDAAKKGRLRKARGESHPRAVLNDNKVRQIRIRYAHGQTNMAQLGRDYGVTDSAIRAVVTRKHWVHVT